MGKAEFEAMPRGAIYVNVGRGATTETAALIGALESGHLGAALLDVTDPEPPPADSALWTMENVLLTPHTAGLHPNYTHHAGELFLENMKRWLAGGPLMNRVDPRLGY